MGTSNSMGRISHRHRAHSRIPRWHISISRHFYEFEFYARRHRIDKSDHVYAWNRPRARVENRRTLRPRSLCLDSSLSIFPPKTHHKVRKRVEKLSPFLNFLQKIFVE